MHFAQNILISSHYNFWTKKVLPVGALKHFPTKIELGHRKDSFGSASYIRARVRGRAGKLGRLLKLGFSGFQKYSGFWKKHCVFQKYNVFFNTVFLEDGTSSMPAISPQHSNDGTIPVSGDRVTTMNVALVWHTFNLLDENMSCMIPCPDWQLRVTAL